MVLVFRYYDYDYDYDSIWFEVVMSRKSRNYGLRIFRNRKKSRKSALDKRLIN